MWVLLWKVGAALRATEQGCEQCPQTSGEQVSEWAVSECDVQETGKRWWGQVGARGQIAWLCPGSTYCHQTGVDPGSRSSCCSSSAVIQGPSLSFS